MLLYYILNANKIEVIVFHFWIKSLHHVVLFLPKVILSESHYG